LIFNFDVLRLSFKVVLSVAASLQLFYSLALHNVFRPLQSTNPEAHKCNKRLQTF